MMLYILKSSICLAAFYLFYLLFLERENMHVFKRYYLLTALLLSFCIPMISIPYTVSVLPIVQNSVQEIASASTASEVQGKPSYGFPMLWSLYSLGVLVFGTVFLKNLLRMRYRIRHNTKIRTPKHTRVLVQEPLLPHTFFNYIFLNKRQFETQQIPKEVLLHEEAHALQKHSLDIVFIEALHVLFWFNPLIYMIKRAIKLNHEFLADRAVILHGSTLSTYQHMLLTFSSNAKQYPLANAIHYSLIKKRFTVMTKQTSKRAIGLRGLLLLPLVAVLVYGFSTKVPVFEQNENIDSPKAAIQDGHYQQPNNSVLQDVSTTEEHVKIFIRQNGTILINNQETTVKGLKDKLLQFNKKHSFEERKNRISVTLYASSDTQMKIITQVKEIIRDYGVSKITLHTVPPPPPPVAVEADIEEVPQVKAPEVIEIDVPEIEEVVEAEVVMETEEVPEIIEVKVPEIEEVELPEVVEIPPPPISPVDHIIAMTKQGAVFYYNGKKISSDMAVQLTKRKKKLHISTTHKDTQQPIVRLSDSPSVRKRQE